MPLSTPATARKSLLAYTVRSGLLMVRPMLCQPDHAEPENVLTHTPLLPSAPLTTRNTLPPKLLNAGTLKAAPPGWGIKFDKPFWKNSISFPGAGFFTAWKKLPDKKKSAFRHFSSQAPAHAVPFAKKRLNKPAAPSFLSITRHLPSSVALERKP